MKKLFLLASLVVVFACSSSDHTEEIQEDAEQEQFNRNLMGEWKAYSYITPASDNVVIISGCEAEVDAIKEVTSRLFQFNDDNTVSWTYNCNPDDSNQAIWGITEINGTKNIIHFGGDSSTDGGAFMFRIDSMTNDEMVWDTKDLVGVTDIYTITFKRP